MKYIVPYNSRWPDRFRRIASGLMPNLPGFCDIHHVGSTSVPGMPAKDIIDLDIECPAGRMTSVVKALSEIGYVHEGDKGIRGREAFHPMAGSAPASWPPHHLYACQANAHELLKHLAYREYLRHNDERAEWLAQQKISADRRANSRDEYIANKNEAYAIITRESLSWARRSMPQLPKM